VVLLLCCSAAVLLFAQWSVATKARLHFRGRSCWIDVADPDQGKNRTRRPLSFIGVARSRGSAACCGGAGKLVRFPSGRSDRLPAAFALARNTSRRVRPAPAGRPLHHRVLEPGVGIVVFAARQHCPRLTRVLVGDGHQHLAERQARGDVADPDLFGRSLVDGRGQCALQAAARALESPVLAGEDRRPRRVRRAGARLRAGLPGDAGRMDRGRSTGRERREQRGRRRAPGPHTRAPAKVAGKTIAAASPASRAAAPG